MRIRLMTLCLMCERASAWIGRTFSLNCGILDCGTKVHGNATKHTYSTGKEDC